MTGTVVRLSFRVLRCDWPGLTGQGRGGPCPKEQSAGASVCLCVCCSTEGDTGVLPPKRHNH